MLLTISPTHTLPPSHFLFLPCPFDIKTILLWHSYHLHVCDLWSLGATHDREHITFVFLRPLSSFNKIDSSCIHSPANWHSLTHFHGWIHSIVCIHEISGQGVQNCLFLSAPAMQCSAAQLLSDALNETGFPTLPCWLENKMWWFGKEFEEK